MNKSLSVMALGLFLALPVPALWAADANWVQLSGHVPAAFSRMPSKGSLAATNLNLAIGLPLRNREALTNLLQQVSDPSSSLYHKYLSPAAFADLFAPSEQDYQAVADFARQHHLKIVGTHSNRMLLDVSGQSTDIENAFGIKFKTYQHPSEARDFFAPDTEPSVPSNLKIQDIGGLNNYGRPFPKVVFKPVTSLASSKLKAHPKAGTGPAGLYMGNDFRNAYVPGTTLNGARQNVALVEFDGYYPSDILEYEAFAGRTNVPLQNVLLDGYNGAAGYDNGEVALDIEMLVSMAPALANIYVYEAPNNGVDQNDVLNRIATDDSSSQISCSWGFPGGPSATTDQILQQMALQGQSFFTAAGDSCAYPAGMVDNPFGQGAPADSPYAISVGGTTLTMNPTATAWVSETVWNWGIEYGLDGFGSSGGISSYYPIPYWQTNVSMTANLGSTVNRNFPDVALTADNIFSISDGGVEYLTGGTSAATPLWAAFTAMVNQQATNSNHAPVGFLNPALYTIALSRTNYAACFNDITTGNNTWSGSPTLFYAVTNYDLCTGLGTPGGTNLINALLTIATNVYSFQVSPPLAPYGTNLAAMNGGSPNGEWSLFVQDAATINSGLIANGWVINLTLGSPVGAEADLGLALNASPSTVSAGGNLTYYLTVTNFGGMSTATNVLVSDSLQDDVTLLSSNVSVGSITRAGDVVSWNVGSLLTNAGGSLTLTVRTATTPESILNSAIASSDTPDPNPSDGSVSVTVYTVSSVIPLLSANPIGTSGAFTLTASDLTGTTVIQASTDLVNWVPVFTTTSSGPITFTDPNKTNYSHRFYRVQTGQ